MELLPETVMAAKYAKTFGVEEAQKLWEAALEHQNGVHDKFGTDAFMWAVFIAVGSQCVDEYADYHKIEVPWDAFVAWCREHKDALLEHDGDVDYFAAWVGRYHEVFDLEESKVAW